MLWFTHHKLYFVPVRFGSVRFEIFEKLLRFGSVRFGHIYIRFGSVWNFWKTRTVRAGSVWKFFGLFRFGSKKRRTDPTSDVPMFPRWKIIQVENTDTHWKTRRFTIYSYVSNHPLSQCPQYKKLRKYIFNRTCPSKSQKRNLYFYMNIIYYLNLSSDKVLFQPQLDSTFICHIYYYCFLFMWTVAIQRNKNVLLLVNGICPNFFFYSVKVDD
jgi:hypothetical protein